MKPTTKINHLITIITLALVMHKSAFAQQQCELKKDKDNIKVFSCKSADSKFRAVRAEFELKASIAEYIAVVQDVDSYKAWHYRVVNPRILKRLNDTELIYYTQISAPWPVSNRDMILHLKLQMNEQGDALTVTLASIADYLPEVNDVVRIPKSYSIMTLTTNKNSGLNVEYFIQVDPGGQIPAWVVNLVSTQAPYETFKNLRNRLAQLRNGIASTSATVN